MKNKTDKLCTIFYNTRTFNKIFFSYIAILYSCCMVVIKTVIRMLIFAWNKIWRINNCSEHRESIFKKYVASPLFFQMVTPVKKYENSDYIFKISLDSRKPANIKFKWLPYWVIVLLINIGVITVVIIMLNNIPIKILEDKTKIGVGIYFVLAILGQLGYGVRWKARVDEKGFSFFLKGFLSVLCSCLFAICGYYSVQKYLYPHIEVQMLLEVAVGCSLLMLIPLFINLPILLFWRGILKFRRGSLKEKKAKLPGIFMGLATGSLFTMLILYIIVSSSNGQFYEKHYMFKNFNLTTGYTIYFSLLVGSIACFGIFLSVFNRNFLGKNLLHYVNEISRSLSGVSGVICFYTSLLIAFGFLPLQMSNIFLIKNEVVNKSEIISTNICHLFLALAIVILVIGAGLLLFYFYQISYAFMNYSGLEKKDQLERITIWFREVLVRDVKSLDLDLDSYAQDHLIKMLIDLNSLTEQEIIEIFNTNEEVENIDSENTVLLAIIKYFNKEDVGKNSKITERLSTLKYTKKEFKNELEKLQKKHGISVETINIK